METFRLNNREKKLCRSVAVCPLPQVPFAACVERWAAAETMEDYASASLGRKARAQKADRFASFPPYLMVQLRK